MGREGKLATGALLLVVAGLILFTGEQTPNPVVRPELLAAIFGGPGFLLLIAGLVPSRSRRASMRFVPARLFGGLALSLAGAVVLVAFYEVVHVAPRVLLVGALLAVPVGALVAASCWTDESE